MSVMWDGKDDWGNRVPSGNYSMDVKAYRADGTAVNVDQTVTGTVSTVSYEKGYPELQLNSGVHAPISDLVSVSGPSTSR
jgi:flagellar hook assembly protein FlgD